MNAISFTLDNSSKIKLYHQLYGQIADYIKSGRLAPGTRLPSVRMLSEELHISKNTVTKTYSELENNGLIFSQVKRGYFVNQHAAPPVPKQHESVTLSKQDNSVPTVDAIVKQYAHTVTDSTASVTKAIAGASVPKTVTLSVPLQTGTSVTRAATAAASGTQTAPVQAPGAGGASVTIGSSAPQAASVVPDAPGTTNTPVTFGATATPQTVTTSAPKTVPTPHNGTKGINSMEETLLSPATDNGNFEKNLLEAYQKVLTSPKRALLHKKSSPFGDEGFRRALSMFIKKFHHIKADPEQIIVGSGAEMLLWKVLQLKSLSMPYIKADGIGLLKLAKQVTEGSLATIKPIAAVAEDTAKSTKQIFLDAHIPVREVPVDNQGISFDFLVTSGTTIVYVTPTDIPIGTQEDNSERRKEILDWANEVSYRHIIEYDTDTSIDAANPSYKSEDVNDKVIYLSSFTNLLCQGINAAFLILPKDVCADYKQHYANFDCTLSHLDQLVLTEFINKGHLESYLSNLENL